MFEYDLEQRSGELLQATDEFCRGTRSPASDVVTSKDQARKASISQYASCQWVDQCLCSDNLNKCLIDQANWEERY